jgi:hypothetical protein
LKARSGRRINFKKMEPTKIIVRFADGRIMKGYTQNFSPNKPTFHLRPADPKASEETIEVLVQELKAVFFVRDFSGDPNYKEQKKFPDGAKPSGRVVEATFKDGERIIGSTLGYDPRRPGFFIFPGDLNWNNLKIFVVSQAVRWVRYI